MNYFIYKQLPVLPPERYADVDLAIIVPRVLELTYTAHDLKPWADDLGYDGTPFPWISERRAQLCDILDPVDVMGEDYPSETFRVHKNNELREFGEYRTQRLVLAAWDKLESGEIH